MLWKQGKAGSYLKFGLAPLFIPGSLTGDRDTGDKCWDKEPTEDEPHKPKSSSVPKKKAEAAKPIPAKIAEPVKIEEAKPTPKWKKPEAAKKKEPKAAEPNPLPSKKKQKPQRRNHLKRKTKP